MRKTGYYWVMFRFAPLQDEAVALYNEYNKLWYIPNFDMPLKDDDFDWISTEPLEFPGTH